MRLDDQLCFALYSATHAIQRRYRPLLQALDLTYPQYLVLLVLWEDDELAVREIAERLFLDSATLTPILKRMEEAGILERQRSTEDQRRIAVTLTTAGRELQERVRGVTNDVTCAAVDAASAPAELIAGLIELRNGLTGKQSSL